MKKTHVTFIFIILFVFCYNIAWANFYVIAGGKRAKRTVLVSPKSTATESGAALISALTKITDASITNPYLICIEPGVYDIGSNSLQMKPYVDMQGSGMKITTITGNINTASGVLIGANNMALSSLAVENTGGGTYSYAILNSSSSPNMIYVKVVASGGTYNVGIFNSSSSSPLMNNVYAYVSGGTSSVGIQNSSSSPYMNNVTAIVSQGDTNIGVGNESSSPSMNRVDIGVYDGTYNWGVNNSSSSSPRMVSIKIEALRGTQNVGIWNNSSSPFMKDIAINAANGTNENFGIRNHNSSLIMMNIFAIGSGGNSEIGIYNTSDSGSIVKIDHSVIYGGDYTVYTVDNCITYIANTRLDGGSVGGDGTNTCAGVYDENYAFSASTCP